MVSINFNNKKGTIFPTS